MKNIKKILLIPVFAIVCMFVRIDSAAAVDYPFSVTTSSIAANGTFEFTLSAKGTFYVDCGDGGTLSGTGVSGGTITKLNTAKYTFKCTYSSAGTKTIRFGGTATQYNTSTSTAAISFYTTAANAALITSISGDLSLIFPYISTQSGKQPRFYQTFYQCTGLTSIPESLFSHLTGSTAYMFRQTFKDCTGITSIPANLFLFGGNNVPGKDNLFHQTFYGCSGLTSIPANLFSHITSSATSLFYYTFSGCTGLTSIPENLFNFGGNDVSGQNYMFSNTFYGCTGLTSIPGNLFSHITSGGNYMFQSTFYGCSGLTSIPANPFSHITSGGTNMFLATFQGCTNLTSVPETLFSFGGSNISGQKNMFSSTFQGCTGLTSIPANLFSHVTSSAESLFMQTFCGCTGLTSIPENLFSFGGNDVSGQNSMFRGTFYGCTGLTSLPKNLFSRVTSVADALFAVAFQNCTGLTGYIPPSMFSGLIANGSPYSGSDGTGMMYQTFYDTGSLATTCPVGTKQVTTGYEDYWDSHVACEEVPAINLTWDGSSTTAPTSCLYGGTFVPPTPPARTGYMFNGWKIKKEKCGIDQLVTSVNGINNGFRRLDGTVSQALTFGITINGQWAVEFSYGTVWGMANCNSVNGGSSGTVATITPESSGLYCWCQATGFTASGNDYTSGPQCTTSASSSWVYRYGHETTSDCEKYCAGYCAVQLQSNVNFRTPVFSAVGQ